MNENTTITQLTESSQPSRSMAFQTVLPQLKQELAEAKKRIDELEAELSAVYSDEKHFEKIAIERGERIDELTTALRQLIAKINASTTVIDKRFSLDGIVHVDYVTALTDLLNGRNEAMKLLEDAPGDVAVYSIYTDPLIVGVAADLECTVDELMEYAADSVGASEVKTIEGCHSTGLHNCYGELWTCKGCGRTFCCAEGSDNMPELCNECWWKAQGDAK